MKQAEFKMLAGLRVFEQVVLAPVPMSSDYELWVFGADVPKHLGNRLIVARNEPRSFASLDTAVRWIRSNGYAGKIEIDGSRV